MKLKNDMKSINLKKPKLVAMQMKAFVLACDEILKMREQEQMAKDIVSDAEGLSLIINANTALQ